MYINVIRNIYKDLKARIITDIKGNYFNIKKGVKQGDPRSLILFNETLEQVFRNLNYKEKGKIKQPKIRR